MKLGDLSAKYEGLKLSAFGNATYRLKIKTDSKLKMLSLKTPEIYSEFRLWINGNIVDESGSFADNGKTKYLNPKVYTFLNEKDFIEIVLEIKNYSHGNAGIGQSFILGSNEKLYKKEAYH